MSHRFGLTLAAGAFLASVFAPAPAQAQLWTWTKDQMTEYTKAWTGERFPDGRPKVSDNLIQRAKGLSSEETGGAQYVDGLQVVHPKTKMAGRAFTLLLMPVRRDLDAVVTEKARNAGVANLDITHALDMLQPGDTLVVDMIGAKDSGPLFTDDLVYYIMTATKGGGLVVDGALRGLDAISNIDMPVYYAPARTVGEPRLTVAGINVPVHVGSATVLPGDLVFGDSEGVSIIPPQSAERMIDNADTTHIHDEWTRKKFDEGKYVSSDIYSSPRDPALRQEYQEYLKKRMEELRAGKK